MRRTRGLTKLAGRSYWREDDARRIVDGWRQSALDQEILEAERAADLTRRRRRRRKAGPGWQTAGVERHVQVIEVPAEDQICPRCQDRMTSIGVDVTRRLKYVPGHCVEEEAHRDKWACGRSSRPRGRRPSWMRCFRIVGRPP